MEKQYLINLFEDNENTRIEEINNFIAFENKFNKIKRIIAFDNKLPEIIKNLSETVLSHAESEGYSDLLTIKRRMQDAQKRADECVKNIAQILANLEGIESNLQDIHYILNNYFEI